jgi:type IV secretory pathway VirB2 component (pilin)
MIHIGFCLKRIRRVLQLTLLGLSLSVALAGGEGIDFTGNLAGISETICNAANFIYGPIGWSVVLVILIWGVIRWLSGMNGGVGMVIGAVVGAFVLLALPAMMEALSFGECVIAGTGG